MNYKYRPEKRDNLFYRIAIAILCFFVIIALLAPIITNDKPLFLRDKETNYWPAFVKKHSRNHCSSLDQQDCFAINAMLPFSPTKTDVSAVYNKPTLGQHLFGTDQLGRDVFAGIIHGTRTAYIVGIGAMLIGLILGLLVGILAGFYGNDRLLIARRTLWYRIGVVIFSLYLYYWLSSLTNALWANYVLINGLICLIVIGSIWQYYKSRISQSSKNMRIPLDSILMRLVDTFKALPAIFVLLLILQIVKSPSIWTIVFVVSIFVWTGFARHARAETIKLRSAAYVQKNMLQGRSIAFILMKDILPFILRPLLVIFAFGVASAVVLEASLSFLGIGLSPAHVSWGTIIQGARTNIDAWWLWFFPGLFLVLFVWSVQQIGRYWENKLSDQGRMISI